MIGLIPTVVMAGVVTKVTDHVLGKPTSNSKSKAKKKGKNVLPTLTQNKSILGTKAGYPSTQCRPW